MVKIGTRRSKRALSSSEVNEPMAKRRRQTKGNEDANHDVRDDDSCDKVSKAEVSCPVTYDAAPEPDSAGKMNDTPSTGVAAAEKPQLNKEEDVYDLEKIRERNLKANAEFLAQLGLPKARYELEKLQGKKPSKASQRGLQDRKVKEILPLRKSLRLQRSNKLPDMPVAAELAEDEHPRNPEGPLLMRDYIKNMPSDEADLNEFCIRMSHLKYPAVKKTSTDLDSYIKSLKKMKINEDRVSKVVPQRIFSVAVHPDESCVLAAAGDKWGRLGFWNVGSRLGEEGVFCFSPHSRPVSCVKFHPDQPSKVYSCSYDGTLRCGDFNTGIFEEIYSTVEAHDIRLLSLDFLSSYELLVSQGDGAVALVDARVKSMEAQSTYKIHERCVKCVNCHPIDKNYFVTACTDGSVNIWDMRNMGKKPKCIKSLAHSKSVDSAYFSPVTGNYILTTAMDDRIRVFDSASIGNSIELMKAVVHDNHTGRWLSNFKAVWHPTREDLFIVGSMARPRRIELYSSGNCQIVKTFSDNMENLASVCSLNAFHPSRNVLVGGNSSGRLHIFMD